MMKAKHINILTAAALAVLFGLSAQVRAEGGYALVVQSSPADAGFVTPGLGVHQMEIDQTVPLSATPKPGYRFAYWLGDVSSAGASETTVSGDSPKLVVAVFVRDDFDEELPGIGIIKGQVGNGGGQRVVPTDLQGGFGTNPGVPRPDYNFPYIPDNPDDDEDPNDDEVPVPGNNDEIPVPGDNEIPEPATLVLLGLGAIVLRAKR